MNARNAMQKLGVVRYSMYLSKRYLTAGAGLERINAVTGKAAELRPPTVAADAKYLWLGASCCRRNRNRQGA
jgi:hypothetical protein